MVYKSLNGLVPEYLSSKFLKRSGMRYSLRDSENKLVVPHPQTKYMKNSFSYSGATLWNSLPCNLRMIKSSCYCAKGIWGIAKSLFRKHYSQCSQGNKTE